MSMTDADNFVRGEITEATLAIIVAGGTLLGFDCTLLLRKQPDPVELVMPLQFI